MDIIKREDARLRGLQRYLTGKPCNHGHLCERYVSNTHCVECRRISSVGQRRKHYLVHKERLNAGSRAYYANLPADKKAEAKARWNKQRREYAKKDRERDRQRHRKYYAANTERYHAYVHIRRARKLAAGGEYTPADIQTIRRGQRDECAICTKPLYGQGEIDHLVPIKLGGSSAPNNLQLLCIPCNRWKASKPLDQVLREIEDQLDLPSLDWDNIPKEP